MKRLAKVLIALAILTVVIVVISLFLQPKNATNIGGQFVADVLSGNYSRGYSLTSPSFRQYSSQYDLKANIEYIDTMCSGKTTLSSSPVSGNLVSLTYLVTGAKSNCHFNVVVIKSGSNWQVNYFNEY